ncbi:hypothetical protein GCM10010156_38400 [Planobispora rosea]|uniref:Uncharacterized protein n=1 Tax=Planobispora rosea TaxID=35762 RepID=A0A8J3RV34_PLARO|nr:hypothetical protein [Planobispora rosea]GGS75895.1 hypothetical protein GCM10010156_38400 [Planobispora rosea]GIH81915.1 hypothetical protein Pro02_03230 [Planobispora rosea]
MSDLLDRLATGRRVAWLLAALVALLVAMSVAATMFADANGGVGILDLAGGRNLFDPRPGGYTPQEAYAMLTAYGPDGRRGHLLILLCGDLLFPLVYVGFTAAALRLAVLRRGAPGWLRTTCVVVPVIYLVADYGENAGIATLLLAYPSRLDALAAAVNTVTSAKTMLGAVMLLTALTAWALTGRARPRPGLTSP